MIIVEYRRTLWSEKSLFRKFEPGATLAQIAEQFDDAPDEFAVLGAITVQGADGAFPTDIPRALWAHTRPKAGTAIFVSCKPQGPEATRIFQIVGAIALIALVTWVSAGGLSFLAPTLLAAGGIGAHIAAAAIGVAGATLLQLLSPPAAGTPVASGATVALATAGVSSNPLGAFQQVPAVLGTMRVSPPFLTRPYTSVESTEIVVHGVVGLCGPLLIEDIKVNGTDVADMEEIEVETLEGWSDDPTLTTVTAQVFEENINSEMSRHRLEDDQMTLIETYTDSYPKPLIVKTCSACDLFRFLIDFPQGSHNDDTDGDIVILFRLRIRNRIGGDWVNLPELYVSSERDAPWRMEIRISWTKSDGSPLVSTSDFLRRAYYSNTEWQANSYFFSSGSGSPAINTNVINVSADEGTFTVFLDPAVFVVGEYDIEITRGCLTTTDHANTVTYEAGYFSFQSLSGPDHLIPAQNDRIAPTFIQNYASFRNQYPIVERELALIAFSARGIQINSISAKFSSYVPTWDGVDWDTVEVSRNPAALLRWVLTGSLNPRPIPDAILDALGDFYDYCFDQGLECNALVTSGSVEQAASLAAQCGDAILRRSEKWGVVIDKDRTDESVTAMFTPNNMTEPLTINKNFLTSTKGIVPSFYNEADDYTIKEIEDPIYDDDLQTDDNTLIEQTAYDGLTSEVLVRRRAKMDLRKSRLRSMQYTWGTLLTHLNVKKGDLVGIAHDILLSTYAVARVHSYTVVSGNITTITLNSEVEDNPVVDDNLFDVADVFTLADIFSVGVDVGVQITLQNGTVIMVPISGVSGAVLTVDGTYASVEGIVAGSIASVGPRTSETRRVIIVDIQPKDRMRATMTAVDEAPGIFDGYTDGTFDSAGTGNITIGTYPFGSAYGYDLDFSIGAISVTSGMPTFTKFLWTTSGSILTFVTSARSGTVTFEGDDYEIVGLGGGKYGYSGPGLSPPYPSTGSPSQEYFTYTP